MKLMCHSVDKMRSTFATEWNAFQSKELTMIPKNVTMLRWRSPFSIEGVLNGVMKNTTFTHTHKKLSYLVDAVCKREII